MPDPAVRVTVFDPVTGETQRAELPADSYILLLGEGMESVHRQEYANGTVQITLKRRPPTVRTS